MRVESIKEIYLTRGANALVPKPDFSPGPFLRVIESDDRSKEPIDFQKYLDRKNRLVIPEHPQVPERFIEREIDPEKPWSAFGQVMFVREHVVDGRRVKKIAAISIAYPGGVGTRMAGEILGKTLGIEQSEFERWEGVKEGGIIAASKEVPDVVEQLTLMDKFVGNSGSVIAGSHAQVEHEVVQHFFGLQDAREDFLNTVKEDTITILTNPEFTGRSAFDDRYESKGVYLIEGIIEDGVWDGGDPQGKRMPLLDMAVDEPHRLWLEWAGKTAAAMEGDGIIGDAEDTETVSECGGGGKCADFFEKMEGDSFEKGKLEPSYAEVSGISGTIGVSSSRSISISKSIGGDRPEITCSNCKEGKNDEGKCKCVSS